MAADAHELLRLWETAKTLRAQFDTYWEDTIKYVWASQGSVIGDSTPGTQRNLELFSDTPSGHSLKYAAVLEALMTRRSTRWHKLTADERALRRDPEVQTYFEGVADELFAARQARGAGCYSALATCYRSEGVLGNDALWVDELVDTRTGMRAGIRYKALALRDVWVTRDFQEQPNRAFRRYPLDAGELVKRFPMERIPAKWLEKAKTKPLEEVELLTVIYPNPRHDPESVLSKAWSVAEIMPTEKAVLDERENGYDELPLIFTSAERAPWESYGRGWAMDLLPTIKTLNEMVRSIVRVAHKQADPPIIVRDDGVLGVTRAVRLRPGGITRGGIDENGRKMVDTLYTGQQAQIAIDLLEYFERKLDRRALVDLFTLLVERPQMTAAEILERSSEKGMFVGPIVGTHQEQKLAPMIEREIGILGRQGRLPEMPPQLAEAGGFYAAEYETPAQQLQRAGEVQAIEQTLARLLELGQTIPEAVELPDWPKTTRRIAELRGFPTELTKSPRAVERAVAARLEAAREQQVLEDAGPAAKAARDAAAAAGATA